VASRHALTHGSAPVKVVLCWDKRRLLVDVIDGGDTRGASLQDLETAFRKGKTSTGLGLGLAIVSRIARTLGGALEHRSEPTTFRLLLPDLGDR
jgi:signal transduction histidine kinase